MPLACAVAVESINVLLEEGMVENSKVRGKRILDGLKKILVGKKVIKDVRGQGLFLGVEINEINGVKGNDFIDKFLDQGVLVKPTKENILRLAPPLVIGDVEEKKILDTFALIFKEYD